MNRSIFKSEEKFSWQLLIFIQISDMRYASIFFLMNVANFIWSCQILVIIMHSFFEFIKFLFIWFVDQPWKIEFLEFQHETWIL